MNANVSAIRTRAEGSLAEQFADLRSHLAGATDVAALRADNFERFSHAGLPNKRVEAWHFTDLRGALREAYPPLARPSGDPQPSSETAAAKGSARLVLVDGFFRRDLSDLGRAKDALRVRPLAEALEEADESLLKALCPPGLADDPAVMLNAAFMAGGVVLDLAPGAQLERPLELVWLSGAGSAAAVFTRSLIRLGAGARLSLVESGSKRADSARQVNAVLIAELGDHAQFDYVSAAQDAGPTSLRIESFVATLGLSARLISTGFVSDARFLRRQTHVRFDGAHADAALAGLSLLRGSEHVDNTLVVEHRAPHCKSRELFKHVVDDEATGVFQGKIAVARGAQKTDGVMASRAILLSDEAGMDNKPELEIFADDVVCGHGATCGDLDEDQLFYAMARGLPRVQAEALLLEAFSAEALELVADDATREVLSARMRAWLGERGS